MLSQPIVFGHTPPEAVSVPLTGGVARASAPEVRAVVLEPFDRDALREGAVQRLWLQLEPPGLGECEIELVLRPEGLHATLVAQRPDTAATLREAEPLIRQALAHRGLELAGFQVAAHTGGHARQMPPQPDRPAARSISAARLSPAPERRVILLTPRHRGLVDLVA